MLTMNKKNGTPQNLFPSKQYEFSFKFQIPEPRKDSLGHNYKITKDQRNRT